MQNNIKLCFISANGSKWRNETFPSAFMLL